MGHNDTKPVLGMAMCYPSTKQPDCRVCLRHRSDYLPDAERRLSVVIDASVAATDGCGMFAHVDLARQAA